MNDNMGWMLGGSAWGYLGDHKPQRIEAPKTDPQTPHEGIEWHGSGWRSHPYCYEIVEDVLNIEPNPNSGEYAFYAAQEDGWYFQEHCTPETIDAIITKLEHFKRTVFGEGD